MTPSGPCLRPAANPNESAERKNSFIGSEVAISNDEYMDICPHHLLNSPTRDVDLIFHWGRLIWKFCSIIAQIRIVYVENFRPHAPSLVTASGNVQASRLTSYFSRKTGMYGQSGPQYPFHWCGMRECCRAVDVCAGCEAETASVFFLHCAACERAMHPQRHNDATPSPLA